MIMASIIFVAVLLDGLRQRQLEKLAKRKIRALA
jgi:hypothetical protein